MLPTDSKARKALPLCTGCLDYFPDALAAVAELSGMANEKHNPGEPLHWSKDKSNDHADCLLRHMVERGKPDADMKGISHTVHVAWRALALLQIEIEEAQKKNAGFAITTDSEGNKFSIWSAKENALYLAGAYDAP